MQATHLSQKEIYEMLRAQIEHEDELIDNRINWLLVAQGFLFVSYSTILVTTVDKKLPASLTIVVAAIAILLNVFSLNGVLAAFLHMGDLVSFWENPHPTDAIDKEWLQCVRKEFPPLCGKTRLAIINGGFGSTLTPIVLGIAWIFLLVNAPQ